MRTKVRIQSTSAMLKRWWGRLEKRRMATESGGAATTGDATAGADTATTGGVMYADEGPYTIDVRHVEEMVGTPREAADSDRVRRDETATRPGTRLAIQGTRPVTRRWRPAGDERDGGDRWDNVYGRRGVRI